MKLTSYSDKRAIPARISRQKSASNSNSANEVSVAMVASKPDGRPVRHPLGGVGLVETIGEARQARDRPCAWWHAEISSLVSCTIFLFIFVISTHACSDDGDVSPQGFYTPHTTLHALVPEDVPNGPRTSSDGIVISAPSPYNLMVQAYMPAAVCTFFTTPSRQLPLILVSTCARGCEQHDTTRVSVSSTIRHECV